MQKNLSQYSLVIFGAIGLASTSAGWLFGACHQICQQSSCIRLQNPQDPEFPCAAFENAQCFPDLWVRGFAVGTCESKPGATDVFKCASCDDDCDPNLPSAADGCGECEPLGTSTTIQECNSGL